MIAPSLPRLRRDPPEPDGDGPFLPPFWPPNPVGEPAYDASCGCEACGCDSDGQWPGYIAESAQDEPAGARKSVPDAQVGDTGQGGKPQGGGSGGGGETGNQVDPAVGAAEVAYLDAFLEALVDAVDHGDNDAAWDAYQDYQGFMGQIGATLEHVEPYDEPHLNPWADTGGGCTVADDRTCGDPRFERTGQIAATTWTDPLGLAVQGIVGDNLRGSWTAEQTALVEAAWNVLVRNQDLVVWALCVATGDPNAGDCILGYLLGDRPVLIEIHDCGPGHQGWGWPLVTWAEGAFDVLTGGLIGPVSLFMNDTPSIWLCTGEAGTLKTLDRCLRLYASDNPCSRDCGVIAMAGLLLHELTHICFRALFESPDTCAVSYLTQNYFVWGARPRFPNLALSACCASLPVPGRVSYADNSEILTDYPGLVGDVFEDAHWVVDRMSDSIPLPVGACDSLECPEAVRAPGGGVADAPFVVGTH